MVCRPCLDVLLFLNKRISLLLLLNQQLILSAIITSHNCYKSIKFYKERSLRWPETNRKYLNFGITQQRVTFQLTYRNLTSMSQLGKLFNIKMPETPLSIPLNMTHKIFTTTSFPLTNDMLGLYVCGKLDSSTRQLCSSHYHR